MSIFIASVILLVLGAAYAVLLRRKLAETVFFAVVTVTGVLYCFGLINRQGCLLYGILFLIVFSVLGAFYLLYTFIKHRKKFCNAELINGCLIYIFFLIFSVLINYKMKFRLFDEFSHWGFIVKHYYFFNAFGTTVTTPNLIYPSYLPGMSLFEYFFTKFSNKFTEYYSYIAMNIMYFSLVMPLIKNIGKMKYFIRSFLLLVTFILLPLTVSITFYQELYVDIILGAFFGFSLLYYFVFKYEKTLFGILMVSAVTFMLTLTKNIGSLFSLIVIGVITVDILFFKRTRIKCMIHKETGLNKLYKILLLILPILTLLFINISYSLILNVNNTPATYKFSLINSIYKLLSGQLLEYQKGIWRNFLPLLLNKKIPVLHISVVTFSMIITIIIIFMSLLNKKIDFRRLITSILLLDICLLGYHFCLILLYMFSFSMHEGVKFASYERYVSTYVLAMIFFIMVFYITKSKRPDNEKKIERQLTKLLSSFSKYAYMLISVVLFITMINVAKSNIGGLIYILRARLIYHFFYDFPLRETEFTALKWKPYFNKYHPYFIDQYSESFWMMQYELIPYSYLANVTWDFQIAPYNTDNVLTFVVTPEEWEKHVLSNEYELLYIFRSDEVLKTIYGPFFKNGEVIEDMCYYVQNNDGHLYLVPVYEGMM